MGRDDRAANARSFSGLDADGEGRSQGGSDKPSAAVSTSQAAGHLLASIPQERTNGTGAQGQETVGMGRGARSRAAACPIVREHASSDRNVAGTSGVREDDPESVVCVCLPPHGPPSQAVRDLTPISPARSIADSKQPPTRAHPDLENSRRTHPKT